MSDDDRHIRTQRAAQEAVKEAARARGLFPEPTNLFAAFIEEVAEVARELILDKNGKTPNYKTEITQAISTGLRLDAERDPHPDPDLLVLMDAIGKVAEAKQGGSKDDLVDAAMFLAQEAHGVAERLCAVKG